MYALFTESNLFLYTLFSFLSIFINFFFKGYVLSFQTFSRDNFFFFCLISWMICHTKHFFFYYFFLKQFHNTLDSLNHFSNSIFCFAFSNCKNNHFFFLFNFLLFNHYHLFFLVFFMSGYVGDGCCRCCCICIHWSEKIINTWY
jgi:hypothetical protein